MDRRCDRCAHWNHTEYEGKVRRANGEREGEGWGYCILLSDSDSHTEADSPTSERAFTLDSSDWASWLMVRADFGCVEWTPGDITDTP